MVLLEMAETTLKWLSEGTLPVLELYTKKSFHQYNNKTVSNSFYSLEQTNKNQMSRSLKVSFEKSVAAE